MRESIPSSLIVGLCAVSVSQEIVVVKDRSLVLARDGQNMLIGGHGEDHLVGGGGDDILIGGSTTHDSSAAGFCSLLKEWNSAADSYTVRVNKLRLLRNTAVIDDETDLLTGASGLDWFFTDLDDMIAHIQNGETID